MSSTPSDEWGSKPAPRPQAGSAGQPQQQPAAPAQSFWPSPPQPATTNQPTRNPQPAVQQPVAQQPVQAHPAASSGQSTAQRSANAQAPRPASRRQTAAASRRGGGGRFALALLLVAAVVVLLFGLVLVGYASIARDLPQPDELQSRVSQFAST